MPTPLALASHRQLLAELRQRLRAAGCFEPCEPEYRRRLMLLVPLVVACYLGLLWAPPGPAWVLLCVAMGLLSVQQGILSHDAGHGMVHRSRQRNALWGHLGMGLLCGLSFTHWRLMHDAHHANPQDEDHDPDIQFSLLFAVYDRAALDRRGLGRLFLAAQALSFWPLAALYSWSLRFDSVVRLWTDPARTRVDRWALAGHYLLWLGVPCLVVGPSIAVSSYLLVSTVIGLNLVAIFAPNHMGMPTLAPDQPRSRLLQQAMTARDIDGGPWLGLLMGGLEHQIEHHLFPRIGAPRLADARRVVVAFCAEHGIPHHRVSFWRAHAEILGHLARLARLALVWRPKWR